MKIKKKMKKFIKICLKCGSIRIKIPPAGIDIKMTQADYCEDCGSWGNFPEVEESKAEYFRKKLKKQK